MIEKFEQKIISIKKKINPKLMSVIVFCTFGVLIFYSLFMTRSFKKEKDLLQNEYNRSMYEMVSYIKNVDIQLKKFVITNDYPLMTTTLADIWRQSNLAKENLANLPIYQNTLSNTSKYLSQVSDFSYYLMKKTSKEEELTLEDYESINKLSNLASNLTIVTNNIFSDLTSGYLSWDKTEKIGEKELSETEDVGNIGSISKTFQDYEGLIYDGAFSEHILDIKPKMLYEGENLKKEITSDDGINKLKELFGDVTVEFLNENDGDILLYEYLVDGSKRVNVTKNEGYIYSMIYDRTALQKVISEDEAIKIGLEFLEKIGVNNMISTYYIINENMITINYASMQDKVVLYPDLIKVKIALDNGEVCSIENMGYIFNHYLRDNLTPKYSIEEAKSRVNSNVEILEERLTVILTDSKKELLAYEFKGSINNYECLIYIDANDLHEEKILMIISTGNGDLTI